MEMSLGARLRQQREERQVALEDISTKSKIKVALLEGLESDDLSRWPQGIYRRSYVRTYAQAIGLEPDVVLQQFLALYPEPEEEQLLVAPESPKRPPTRLRFLLNAAFGAARQVAADTRDGHGARLDHVTRIGPEHVAPVNPPELIESAEALDAAERPDVENVDLPLPFISPSLTDIADVCTRVGRASRLVHLQPALADAVRMLNAVGAVLWKWESHKAALRPRVSYGYTGGCTRQISSGRPRCRQCHRCGVSFRQHCGRRRRRWRNRSDCGAAPWTRGVRGGPRARGAPRRRAERRAPRRRVDCGRAVRLLLRPGGTRRGRQRLRRFRTWRSAGYRCASANRSAPPRRARSVAPVRGHRA